MDIIKLTEEMKQLLEGDVISMMDYKRNKASDEVQQAVGAEVDNYVNQAVPAEVIEPEQPEEQENTNFVRDYTKAAEDVQVGDILYCSWGYSMTIIDFYRVTDRKAKSIKLEKLADKIVSGDHFMGDAMPTEQRDRENMQYKVKGKTFRIIPSDKQWNPKNPYVCKVNGEFCNYWDGTPKSFDHLD